MKAELYTLYKVNIHIHILLFIFPTDSSEPKLPRSLPQGTKGAIGPPCSFAQHSLSLAPPKCFCRNSVLFNVAVLLTGSLPL